jgi:hypothetical protein
MLKTLLREPLVHFAATALLLFAIYDLVAPENQDVGETVIVVDRTAALTFLQFRMKSFDAEAAAARFEAMSPKEQQRLIDDYAWVRGDPGPGRTGRAARSETRAHRGGDRRSA